MFGTRKYLTPSNAPGLVLSLIHIYLILTDIRMPYMDGLTLAERVRQKYPSMKIVIFSGYDDFEYAKQAIKSVSYTHLSIDCILVRFADHAPILGTVSNANGNRNCQDLSGLFADIS